MTPRVNSAPTGGTRLRGGGALRIGGEIWSIINEQWPFEQRASSLWRDLQATRFCGIVRPTLPKSESSTVERKSHPKGSRPLGRTETVASLSLVPDSGVFSVNTRVTTDDGRPIITRVIPAFASVQPGKQPNGLSTDFCPDLGVADEGVYL